jgi:acetolactate synthase small subunit
VKCMAFMVCMKVCARNSLHFMPGNDKGNGTLSGHVTILDVHDDVLNALTILTLYVGPQVLGLVDTFRARIVDVAEESLTIEVAVHLASSLS